MYLKNRVTLLLRDGQFNSNNEGDPTISNDTIVTNDQQVEQIHVRCNVSKCSAEDKQEHTVSQGLWVNL